MAESSQLLRRYQQHGDEDAFQELVCVELDLVYSTALRLLGDPELAKDVSQVVFTDLAKKAAALSASASLSGWLYQHTGFVAGKVRRGETRRRWREEKAVRLDDQRESPPLATEELVPFLDAAPRRLRPKDRDALVLRFFRGQTLNQVGQSLGISENAARMRVDRALSRLRNVLAKRGLTSSAATLAAALATLTSPAPTGMASVVTTSALAAKASTTAISFGLIHILHLMNTTKVAGGIAAVAIASALTVPILMHKQIENLQTENAGMRRQSAELADLRVQNERLEKVQADAEELTRLRREQGELLRLRGEVGLLRQRLRDLENAKPKAGSDAQAAAEETPVRTEVVPGFYDAASWADEGFSI
jgi:RNA polymerase sigma factor (sigma-70 family)